MRDTTANLIGQRNFAINHSVLSRTLILTSSSKWVDALQEYYDKIVTAHEHGTNVSVEQIPPFYIANITEDILLRITSQLPAIPYVSVVLIYKNEGVAFLHYPINEQGFWKTDLGIGITTLTDDMSAAKKAMELINKDWFCSQPIPIRSLAYTKVDETATVGTIE
jgi:hypothetical protein